MANRRSKDEARGRLLDAGREEFLQTSRPNASDVLAHLRLDAVAERAGYSGPGMIYNLWKDVDRPGTPKEHFLRDLLIEIAQAPYRTASVIQTFEDVVVSLPDLVETTRLVANSEFDRSSSHLDEIYRGFWIVVSGLQVDGVAQALMEVERTSIDELASLYELALTAFDRKMVAPLTERQLAMALRAQLSGTTELFAILTNEHDQIIDLTWKQREGWSLFSIAALAIIEGFTEPTTPG
ncbi:MAG: hypothetical protein V3V01_06590 [Acidimicrobiales bacterium]